MKKVIFVLSLLNALTLACSGIDSDRNFERLANNYIQAFLKVNPEWATQLGDHRYDHLLYDFSKAGISRDRQLSALYLDSLAAINPADLNATNQIDFQILRANLQYNIFTIDTLKTQEWNPLAYNVGQGIYGLIARDFAPLQQRMESLKSRLQRIPEVLEQAKTNLKNPPTIHTETAILQNKGTITMVRDELNMFLDKTPGLRNDFKPVQDATVEALESYGRWLEEVLLPRSNGEFRLGPEKYRRKLYYALHSELNKEQILASAEKDLQQTQAKLYETALPLFEKYTGEKGSNDKKAVSKTVLDKLAETRPDNDTIVELAEKTMVTTTDFVRNSNLITVPEEAVRVIVMPEFQRGVAVAYCDSPGPLEKDAETFYAISPTPKDWSKERIESFFKEYNNYMLENLSIHEAMPGHYLQLAHANKFNAPTMVRSIFYNGTFVEGWATYAEELMAGHGYGGPEVKMQQLKMRLRLIINAIIDQKIHTAGMTEQEAMDLMMNEGFQEEGEAAGKWRRACLTSSQLSTYYVGNIEINDIRRRYETKHGANTDLKKMHDAMLAFGSPPAKYVKQMLGI